MIVIKFGGTSVGDPRHLRRSIEIVSSARARKPIVVVSALAGVTNDLVEASRLAAAQDFDSARTVAENIRRRHEDIAFELIGQKSDFLASFNIQLQRQVDQILAVLEGMSLVGEITPRANDRIIAIGEKLSSVLFTYTLRLRTLAGVHVDSEDVILTDEQFGAATPDMEATRIAASKVLLPELERDHIPIVGGFFGRSRRGATTTLGRGGSDYSAAIIGAAVEAEEIQIWTDVDGMMTTDPRVIPSARVIESISYAEAAEMAYFGAKVLHPRTITPAVERSIPIRVLNTHNPEAPGTLVTAAGPGDTGHPRAIAIRKGIVVIEISSETMLGAHGFLARIFEVFARHAVSVDVLSSSEVSVSATIDRSDRLDELVLDLARLGTVRLLRDQAIIAVIGRNVLGAHWMGEAVFRAIEGSRITMLSLGSSGLNLSLVVAEETADGVLRALHHELFEIEREA